MGYRFYSFVNHLYMNEKQWGIQTSHCVSTMSVTYKHNTKQHKAYGDWATSEPTIIMCQGGNVAMLHDLFARLKPLADSLGLPVVKFHEDEASLGGIITSVAVLVPDRFFNCCIEQEVLEDEDGTRVPIFTNPETLEVFRKATKPVEHEFLSIVKLARLA